MRSLDLEWLLGIEDDVDAWDQMFDWDRRELITLLFEFRDEVKELDYMREGLEK